MYGDPLEYFTYLSLTSYRFDSDGFHQTGNSRAKAQGLPSIAWILVIATPADLLTRGASSTVEIIAVAIETSHNSVANRCQ